VKFLKLFCIFVGFSALAPNEKEPYEVAKSVPVSNIDCFIYPNGRIVPYERRNELQGVWPYPRVRLKNGEFLSDVFGMIIGCIDSPVNEPNVFASYLWNFSAFQSDPNSKNFLDPYEILCLETSKFYNLIEKIEKGKITPRVGILNCTSFLCEATEVIEQIIDRVTCFHEYKTTEQFFKILKDCRIEEVWNYFLDSYFDPQFRDLEEISIRFLGRSIVTELSDEVGMFGNQSTSTYLVRDINGRKVPVVFRLKNQIFESKIYCSRVASFVRLDYEKSELFGIFDNEGLITKKGICFSFYMGNYIGNKKVVGSIDFYNGLQKSKHLTSIEMSFLDYIVQLIRFPDSETANKFPNVGKNRIWQKFFEVKDYFEKLNHKYSDFLYLSEIKREEFLEFLDFVYWNGLNFQSAEGYKDEKFEPIFIKIADWFEDFDEDCQEVQKPKSCQEVQKSKRLNQAKILDLEKEKLAQMMAEMGLEEAAPKTTSKITPKAASFGSVKKSAKKKHFSAEKGPAPAKKNVPAKQKVNSFKVSPTQLDQNEMLPVLEENDEVSAAQVAKASQAEEPILAGKNEEEFPKLTNQNLYVKSEKCTDFVPEDEKIEVFGNAESVQDQEPLEDGISLEEGDFGITFDTKLKDNVKLREIFGTNLLQKCLKLIPECGTIKRRKLERLIFEWLSICNLTAKDVGWNNRGSHRKAHKNGVNRAFQVVIPHAGDELRPNQVKEIAGNLVDFANAVNEFEKVQ